MSVGGSIESISIKGRGFAVAADADANVKLGGSENEVQRNGNSTARIISTSVPWSISGLAVSVDIDRDDLDFLQDISDSKEFVACSITYASGVTYGGTGIIVGEIPYSTQNSTAEISLNGEGRLVKL